jgi:hypothetical protein
MTNIKGIRTATLAVLFAALPIGLIAQTQTPASNDVPGAVAVTMTPVAVEPIAPAVAVSNTDDQRSTISVQPDYSKNPYWAPRDEGYIESNQSGG